MFDPKIRQNIKSQLKETNKQALLQTMGFISSAFVLIGALAWNEAIKELIAQYLTAGSGLISKIIYAAVVTLIAVIVTSKLNNLAARSKNEDHQ